jgi:hypothetical protein
MAGFISERAAGFILECMAGFVGIRTPQAALQWRMPELTRRRSSDAREECRHVNYGGACGTIAIRSDNPIDITG